MASATTLLSLLFYAATALAQTPIACPDACSSADTCVLTGTDTYTCHYTTPGSSQGFFVPDDATNIKVDASSGHGGSSSNGVGIGGNGVSVKASYIGATNPRVIVAYVGGNGADGKQVSTETAAGGASNRNSGGNGGSFTTQGGETGAGGGGATFVTMIFDGSNPDVMRLGAGGGACPLANGGNAGLVGQAGDDGQSSSTGAGLTGGQGGQLNASGSGGQPNGTAGANQGSARAGADGQKNGAGGGAGGSTSSGSGATQGDDCSGGGGGSTSVDTVRMSVDSQSLVRTSAPHISITYTIPITSGGPNRRRLLRHRRKLERRVERERRLGLIR